MQGNEQPRLRRGWFAAALASALALAPAVSPAEEEVSFVPTPAGHVLLVVPAQADGWPVPVVLALPDATGPDGRSRPYLDRLNALGVATVEEPHGPDDEGGAPRSAAGDLAGLLAALAADPRLDASRLGVLAFGAGGGAALREPALAETPLVLLYPGCSRLPPPGAGRPVLLLHGGVDRSDPSGACAAWAAGRGDVRRHEYLHATYGWDFSDGPWSDGLALLPVPDGPWRQVLARSDPATTADAAARAASFLATALAPAGVALRARPGGPIAPPRGG